MIKKIKIANKFIGQGYPCFIIAEAGVNHNGKIDLAKKMIDVAKSTSADAIKFQAFRANELVSSTAPKATYQVKAVPNLTQYEMLKRLELSESELEELSRYCQRKKILFISSAFDFQSAELLQKLKVPAFKIGSGELTNLPLLKKVAQYQKPIILSTGMANLQEIAQAIRVIYSTGNRSLVLLHCTSNYPTKYEDVNLRAMITLKQEFNLPVGYSDHTEGLEIPVAAVAMGAGVIEKHFTLDRNLPGPDHQASLEGEELKRMIQSIRKIELALGDGIKRAQKAELEMRKIVRRSLVAAIDIAKGTLISIDMVAIKRPGTGIKPAFLSKIIHKKAKTNIKKDQLLSWTDFE